MGHAERLLNEPGVFGTDRTMMAIIRAADRNPRDPAVY